MLLKNITDYFEMILSANKFGKSTKLIMQVGPQTRFSEKIVKKILITQFLTLKTAAFAVKEKYNLILCRYGIPSISLTQIDEFAQKHLVLLLHGHIMVGVFPDLWNIVSGGPIEYLASTLGLDFYTSSDEKHDPIIAKTYQFPKPQKIGKILSTLHRTLNLERIKYVSNSNIKHEIVTIFPHNIPSKELQSSKYRGADLVISPLLSSALLTELTFYKLSLIQIPFHNIVESTLRRLSMILATEFPRIECMFYPSDINVLSHLRNQNH